MSIDILYLAHNRKRFTQHSWQHMILNTDWSMVERLVIYDDCSEDGTFRFLREQVDVVQDMGIDVSFTFQVPFSGPVAIMNHYIRAGGADLFVKIDNDIVVPPNYLRELNSVMRASDDLELLGMEGGQIGLVQPEGQAGYSWVDASHIGGVGMMRRSAFTSRMPMQEWGRFGFTEWQQELNPVRGWIYPDLLVTELGRIPLRPWSTLSRNYMRKGWQRPWLEYDVHLMHPYWDWWHDVESA